MTTATEPTTATVAEELVSFCRAGRNLDAINTLYSPDIVSIESMGNETMPREQKGIDAIRGKNQWWSENNEVHSATVDGPSSRMSRSMSSAHASVHASACEHMEQCNRLVVAA